MMQRAYLNGIHMAPPQFSATLVKFTKKLATSSPVSTKDMRIKSSMVRSQPLVPSMI